MVVKVIPIIYWPSTLVGPGCDSVLSARSPRRSPRSPRRDDRYKDSWCSRCFLNENYVDEVGCLKKRLQVMLIGHGYESQFSSIPQMVDCDLLPLGEK